MKNIVVILSILVSSFSFAKNVDLSSSVVEWYGTKKFGKGHNGVISLKSANLEVNKDQILGGTFTVDMKSIKVTDIKENEGGKKLEAHLMNADFFDVAKYPVAKYVITSAKNNKIKGKLYIKSEFQPGSKIKKDDGKEVELKNVMPIKGGFVGELTFNRIDFGVKYNSTSIAKFANIAKDYIINDDVNLKIKLMLK